MRARRAKGWVTFGSATLGIALASLGLLDTRADAAPAATYGAEIGSVLQSWHTPPLFVVGDHFVIAPLGAGAEFRCVQGDGVLSQVAEDVTFQHTIAWRRGASTLALLAGIAGTFSVHEVSCGGPSVAIGSVVVPSGLEPLHTLVPQMQARLEAGLDGSMIWMSGAGLVRVALSPPGETAALVTSSAAMTAAIDASPGATPETASDQVRGYELAPDGTPFVVVARSIGNALYDLYVVALGTAAPVVRAGPIHTPSPSVWLAWVDALDALVVGNEGQGTSPPLVVPRVPQAGDARLVLGLPLLQPKPTAGDPDYPLSFSRFIGSSTDLFAVMSRPGVGSDVVRAVTLDTDLFDLDDDALPAGYEAAIGTSDRRPDTDGDGVPEVLEVGAGTDPTSGASVPTVAAPRTVLAPTPFFRSALPFKGECLIASDSLSTFACPALTVDPACDGACASLDGRTLPNFLDATPSPDGSHVLYLDDGHVRMRDVASASDVTLAVPGTVSVGHAWFLSDDAALAQIEGAGDARKIVRARASDSFAVFDPTRVCAMLGAASDVCGTTVPAVVADGAGPVGVDPRTGEALVLVTRYDQKTLLFGVSATSARLRADLTSLAKDGETVTAVRALDAPGEGYIAWISEGNAQQIVTHARRLDDLYRPTSLAQVTPPTLGNARLRNGRYARMDLGFYALPAPAGEGSGCLSSDGLFVCPSSTQSGDPFATVFPFEVEWAPVGPSVRPGEVLAFSPSRDEWSAGTGDHPERWVLTHVATNGADATWLHRADFEALLSVDERALIEGQPLGDITDMDVSPDGLTVCLAEPEQERTWEIVLDGATREAASARLASATFGHGCTYDEHGSLVLVREGELRVGDEALSLPEGEPLELARGAGAIVVARRNRPALCVRGDGVRASTSADDVVAVAAAPEHGGFAWMTSAGDAFTGDDRALCDGASGARPFFTDAPAAQVKFLTRLFNRFTYYPIVSSDAALAVRQDGVAFVGPDDIDGGHQGMPGPMMFHVFLGAAGATFGVHDTTVHARALAVVPGDTTDVDWGYDARPGGPPVAWAPPAPPPATAPPDADGCGCRVVDAAPSRSFGAAALALLAMLLGARGRWSRLG